MDSNHLCSKQQKGITPEEIKFELDLQGVTIGEIARVAGVTLSAVSQTIRRYNCNRYGGHRIRPLIARALDKKVNEIWSDAVA